MVLRDLSGEHAFQTNNIDKINYDEGFRFDIRSDEVYVGGDFEVVTIGWYTLDGHYQIFGL